MARRILLVRQRQVLPWFYSEVYRCISVILFAEAPQTPETSEFDALRFCLKTAKPLSEAVKDHSKDSCAQQYLNLNFSVLEQERLIHNYLTGTLTKRETIAFNEMVRLNNLCIVNLAQKARAAKAARSLKTEPVESDQESLNDSFDEMTEPTKYAEGSDFHGQAQSVFYLLLVAIVLVIL